MRAFLKEKENGKRGERGFHVNRAELLPDFLSLWHLASDWGRVEGARVLVLGTREEKG